MKTKPFSELILIDTKGDVSFYEDAFGQQYQSVLGQDAFAVKDGKMSYKKIATWKGYTIKYNVNGCNGFSIWKSDLHLEDNIWTLKSVKKVCEDRIAIPTEKVDHDFR